VKSAWIMQWKVRFYTTAAPEVDVVISVVLACSSVSSLMGVCLASSHGSHGRRRYAAAASSTTAGDGDTVPAELTGAVKWTTVKISDDTTPTTDSIFLGADEVCAVKHSKN